MSLTYASATTHTACGDTFCAAEERYGVQKMIRGTKDDTAATAAQIVLRPLKQASCFKCGLSLLQLHVGDVPLHEQQVHLLYPPSEQLQSAPETVEKEFFST